MFKTLMSEITIIFQLTKKINKKYIDNVTSLDFYFTKIVSFFFFKKKDNLWRTDLNQWLLLMYS